MIAELDKAKVPEKEIVKIVMETYGVDEVKANFIIALERGEIDGDIVIIERGQTPPD